MPSAFVPVYSADQVMRRLQDRVQRAVTAPAQSPALRTESFDAAAGATYRVRPTTTSTLDVRLPKADASNFGKLVTLLISRPIGSVRVTCPTGTVNASTSALYSVTGLHHFASDGDGDWLEVGINRGVDYSWTGSHAFSGSVSLGGNLRLDAVISPTITANQNDWSPTGFNTCTVVRCEVDATPRTVTGMVPPSDNGHLRFFFNSGSNTLTFSHQDVLSSANNRIVCPSATNVALGTNDGIIGWYDFASNRWRLVGL